MIDHSNREDFLNAIAEKAGRPRHQLKDHPFVPLNDLPETTLSGHSQDELEAIAKQNSEAVHVTFGNRAQRLHRTRCTQDTHFANHGPIPRLWPRRVDANRYSQANVLDPRKRP